MLTRLSEFLGGLPVPAVIALVALLAIQLALQIYALVDLSRRSWVPGEKKWLWVVVIIAGNLVGAVIYLGIARRATPPASMVEGDRIPDPHARKQALDRLYGGPDRR